MNNAGVIVAMSGGVDSVVAAALLKDADYDVSGIYMQLSPQREHNIIISNLKNTCDMLGISLHVIDLQAEFKNIVIDDLCHEYSLGRTPNPCVICNQRVKFGLLLDRVLQMGADYLATGHYARIESSSDGYRLLKAIDSSKDQSYFLYTLGQKELQQVLFPLGNLYKTDIIALATNMGLSDTISRSSQDICFIPDGDYRSFITGRVRSATGDIIDTAGNILGKHEGLANYTIGQRQGLGIASKERLYVIKLDKKTNRLVVGSEDQLSSNKLKAGKLTWVSGEAPRKSINIKARVRYQSVDAEAMLNLNDGFAKVKFSLPQKAIAPGQSVVFYQGDIVIGGGIIEDTEYA